MSKSKPKKQPSRQQLAKLGARRMWVVAVIALLVVGAGFTFLLLREKPADFETLLGRWVRPDGGYVLQIRAVGPSGAIDAAYFNPRPINIAKAEATRAGASVDVFVELRAPNYPGSTYRLTYDPQQDQLKGNYFQAVERQNFYVTFLRVK